MQKFKTMSKLKLKTVQNGTESGNPNLMDNGSYDYIDGSGYVINGSGVFDASGNVILEGQIRVDAGNVILYLGNIPSFRVTATWESGLFDLPVIQTGNNGCVTVSFVVDENYIDFPASYEVFNLNGLEVEEHWMSPFTAVLSIYYILKQPQGMGQTSGHTYDIFSLPCTYIPPQPHDE